MQLACPAKINLTLEVLQRRDDGYHGIRSVMVPLEYADDLTIEGAPSFSFECTDPALRSDDNLAVRAAKAIEPAAAVRIALTKRIPTQAGLGGGSSDAAGVLRAAMRGAFGEQRGRDWLALARSIGSDVPFFLTETAALVEGTGERVTAAGALPPWHVLLVKPPAAISTAEAYAELDRHDRPTRPRATSISIRALEALQRADFTSVETLLSNDFHDPISALAPQIQTAISALKSAGATNALLTGSGSTVFTIAEHRETVDRIVNSLGLDDTYTVIPTAFAQQSAWNAESR